MGTVNTEITIKNAVDTANAKTGLIGKQDVRSMTVNATVDTGAASIVINEDQCQKLGLHVMEERKAKMADGRSVACKLTTAVEVHWKDRSWICPALVVPGAQSVLLGVIPLEGMDLIVNTKTQELVGAHGDKVELMLLYSQINSSRTAKI